MATTPDEWAVYSNDASTPWSITAITLGVATSVANALTRLKNLYAIPNFDNEAARNAAFGATPDPAIPRLVRVAGIPYISYLSAWHPLLGKPPGYHRMHLTATNRPIAVGTTAITSYVLNGPTLGDGIASSGTGATINRTGVWAITINMTTNATYVVTARRSYLHLIIGSKTYRVSLDTEDSGSVSVTTYVTTGSTVSASFYTSVAAAGSTATVTMELVQVA